MIIIAIIRIIIIDIFNINMRRHNSFRYGML